MAKIINKEYREFLDKGSIEILQEEDITNALNNIMGKNKIEARALLILLYYTGARPSEVLDLKSKDLIVENNYLVIQMPGKKRGLSRPIRLRRKLKLVKEVWSYASSVYPTLLLFPNFRSNNKKQVINKKGEIKTYEETSNKLRYHFKKWFKKDMTPYFLRHSRFSSLMMKGADREELRIMKGSKTYESVTPYVHLSSKTSKKLAGRID
jgi:integrase/recombinase XerD